eukprot:7480737-Pyramimonas_sp.AAC.1
MNLACSIALQRVDVEQAGGPRGQARGGAAPGLALRRFLSRSRHRGAFLHLKRQTDRRAIMLRLWLHPLGFWGLGLLGLWSWPLAVTGRQSGGNEKERARFDPPQPAKTTT